MKITRWAMTGMMVFVIFSLGACQMNAEQEKEDEQGTSELETLARKEAKEASEENEAEQTLRKEVLLQNTAGETIGKAILTQMVNGVLIALQASDLSPGEHGFHIHENGKCEAPDFESAGGHFNPTSAKHGFDYPGGPHAGDLPNILVAEDGRVQAEFFTDRVTLEAGKEHTLLREGGTSLMIHEKADDYHSQPAGDAGNRMACGVMRAK